MLFKKVETSTSRVVDISAETVINLTRDKEVLESDIRKTDDLIRRLFGILPDNEKFAIQLYPTYDKTSQYSCYLEYYVGTKEKEKTDKLERDKIEKIVEEYLEKREAK